MDDKPAIAKHAGFERLQAHLMALLAAIDERFTPRELGDDV
jgi:hypothetical protein